MTERQIKEARAKLESAPTLYLENELRLVEELGDRLDKDYVQLVRREAARRGLGIATGF